LKYLSTGPNRHQIWWKHSRPNGIDTANHREIPGSTPGRYNLQIEITSHNTNIVKYHNDRGKKNLIKFTCKDPPNPINSFCSLPSSRISTRVFTHCSAQISMKVHVPWRVILCCRFYVLRLCIGIYLPINSCCKSPCFWFYSKKRMWQFWIAVWRIRQMSTTLF